MCLPTSKEISTSTILPPHPSTSFRNSLIAKNAINMTAIFATNTIDIDAPTARASMKFFSSLKQNGF